MDTSNRYSVTDRPETVALRVPLQNNDFGISVEVKAVEGKASMAHLGCKL